MSRSKRFKLALAWAKSVSRETKKGKRMLTIIVSMVASLACIALIAHLVMTSDPDNGGDF